MLDVKQIFEQVVQSIKQGKLDNAASHLSTLIKYKPELYEDWLGIGKLALLAGEVNLAKESLKLFEKRPNSSLNIELAYLAALVEVGEFRNAVNKAELMFKDNNKSPELSHFLSTVYLQMGDSEAAAKYAQQTLSFWPHAGEAWLILVNSLDIELDGEIFKKMLSYENQLLDKSNARSKSSFLAALAKVYEDHNNFELAFQYAQKSKAIISQESDFSLAKEVARVKKIIQKAAVTQVKNDLQINCNDQSPIFIVGLPRSGTTLLEQILCSHSKVLGGGEFNGMERAARCLTLGEPIGESMSHFETNSKQLTEIKRVYLKFAHEKFGSDGVIVDKSLNNSRFVWLIRQVFPDSPIIFLRRNPIDSAWSCFKTHFSQGMSWSCQQQHIADYFNCEFELYKHWNKIFANSVLNVNYADLINNTEKEIKTMVEYCQLEFESSMLEFHQSTRPIFTASTVQARKKIYSTSLGSTEVEHLMTEFVDNFKGVL
ncbi:tetratricopeptide repeat-containing sulfotransferase family protein [Paraglaciecola sp.]|uniref:tetratricopeptide repeat-containing sulfotransferase family protein n=1 Tax=Paraglaciecola sp. TaxID=1920173 RepID=UPI00273D6F47|nr:tetratricopeptide repeat-containing sulfotransferase family protein [Paraglaciecola sp.]MDP5033273.1 sulfotransferase [Paraglaciecola sp.]